MQIPKMLHEKFDPKLDPTKPNMSQRVASRCPNVRNMLRPTILRYVAQKCSNRLAGLVQQCCARACAVVRFSIPNMSQHVATGRPNARNMLRPIMLLYAVRVEILGSLRGCLCKNRPLILLQVRNLRKFIGALYEGECVSYSPEYFQNFLHFERSLVLKTLWADKFYYCFKLRDIIHVVQQFQKSATFGKRAFKVELFSRLVQNSI